MKKILFRLFILPLLFAGACSDNNGDKPTIVIPKDQKNQTAYADDNEKTIHFTATEDWYTETEYTDSKATDSEDPWISLDPPRGEAGDITIKLTLSTNFSGADRKATIRIVCGNTIITITVEQKGKTEEGKIPDEDIPVIGERKITKIVTYDEERKANHIVFHYDEEGRIKEYSLYKENAGKQETEYVDRLTYTGNQIISDLKAYNDGYRTNVTTYTLSDNRIISARESGENFDCYTWHYDDAGNVTEYIEKYKTTVGSIDPDDNEGPSMEVIDSARYLYNWENGIIKTLRYYPNSSNSNEVVTWEYEYYELSEIQPLPCPIKLQYFAEELNGEDMTLYGYTGNVPARFIKKVTTTGDRWNKDNGTTTYRYVTDNKGYVTQIYCKWEATADKTDAKEFLECEITYE